MRAELTRIPQLQFATMSLISILIVRLRQRRVGPWPSKMAHLRKEKAISTS